MNTIVFTHSYHHGNTQKIAEAIAAALNAGVVSVDHADALDVADFDLVGFGAGIDGGKHYLELLAFAENLPNMHGKRVFIFSTSATYSEKRMATDHKALRDILQAKGFEIVGEFGCKGFTTRSIFNLVGGANKGRPNKDDMANAKRFADELCVYR